jgi:hypothetical protein
MMRKSAFKILFEDINIEYHFRPIHLGQGLLKLLYTVYSEGKSCLRLRNFQNPFNKDKSVGL